MVVWDLISGFYDLITFDFFAAIKTKVYGKLSSVL